MIGVIAKLPGPGWAHTIRRHESAATSASSRSPPADRATATLYCRHVPIRFRPTRPVRTCRRLRAAATCSAAFGGIGGNPCRIACHGAPALAGPHRGHGGGATLPAPRPLGWRRGPDSRRGHHGRNRAIVRGRRAGRRARVRSCPDVAGTIPIIARQCGPAAAGCRPMTRWGHIHRRVRSVDQRSIKITPVCSRQPASGPGRNIACVQYQVPPTATTLRAMRHPRRDLAQGRTLDRSRRAKKTTNDMGGQVQARMIGRSLFSGGSSVLNRQPCARPFRRRRPRRCPGGTPCNVRKPTQNQRRRPSPPRPNHRLRKSTGRPALGLLTRGTPCNVRTPPKNQRQRTPSRGPQPPPAKIHRQNPMHLYPPRGRGVGPGAANLPVAMDPTSNRTLANSRQTGHAGRSKADRTVNVRAAWESDHGGHQGA